MQIKNINEQISKADGISYWIDQLKLNLQGSITFLSEILNKIDDDNSNVYIENINEHFFSMVKIRTRNGPALNIIISIDDIPHTIWQYLEYSSKNKKKIKSYWSLTYYSTYFRLIETGLLDSSIEKQFFWNELNHIKFGSISRIDYKIDFFYKNSSEIIKMEDIIEYRSDYKSCEYSLDKKDYQDHQELLFKRLNNNKPIHYDIKSSFRKWDFQNGWTVWNRDNKSLFIRCYEKLIDTLSKGKVMLYDDYFLYPNVFRLELELLTKFNKKENWFPFIYNEISELENKIQRFIGLDDKIEGEKFLYQYKTNKETDFTKLRRQKDFWGRWYSIYQQGFNPFIILYKIIREKVLNITKFNKIITVFEDYMSRREEEMDEEFRPKNWKTKTKFYN